MLKLSASGSIYSQLMNAGSDVPISWLENCGLTKDKYLYMLGDYLGRAQRFDITNVAEYFWQNEKTEWYWIKDFPNTAPLFPYMWFEYEFPRYLALSEGLVEKDIYRHEPRFGALVVSVEPTDEFIRAGNDIAERSGKSPVYAEDVKWLLIVDSYIGRAGQKPIGPVFSSWVFVGHDGSPLLGPITLATSGERMAHDVGFRIYPIGLALSFMHCKNVLVDDEAPVQSRQAFRERQRRGIPSEPTFKTLKIEPMRQVLQTEGRSTQVGLQKALHICRGHFSNYTEEKPLFGKYSGRFWIPAHVRGSADAGRVIKDYDVRAPREAA